MMRESRLRRIRLPGVAALTDDAFVLVPLQNVQEFQDNDNDDDDDDDNAEDNADGKEEDDGSGQKNKNKKKKQMCPKQQWDEMNESL